MTLSAAVTVLSIAGLIFGFLALTLIVAGLDTIPAVRRALDDLMPEHPWWTE